MIRTLISAILSSFCLFWASQTRFWGMKFTPRPAWIGRAARA